MNTQDGAIHFENTIDNKQFDAAIAESTKRIQGMSTATVEAGAKMDKVYQNLSSESTNFSTIVKQNARQEMGRIEELRASIAKLTEARDKSTSIEKIEAYNQRIKEETDDLKELTHAGLDNAESSKKQEDATTTLTQTIGKWALGLGGAAAILGVLKKAFLETTGGLNAFNIVGAISSQLLYDITSGAGMSIEKLSSAMAIQQQFNALRTEGYAESVKVAQLNNQYQQEYAASLDATLSREERIKTIDGALKIHDESIELRSEHVRKALAATKAALENQPTSEKYMKEYAGLMAELENLDAERYESTKRLLRQRSILIKEGIDEEIKWRKDLHDRLQKAADEQIEIDKSIPEQLKLLNEAVANGDSAQVVAIAKRIKILQGELDIRTQIAKAALLSAMTDGNGDVTKIDTSNINIPTLGSKISLPGLQDASIQAQKGADLGKLKEWNAIDDDHDKNKIQNQKEILQGAIDITMQMAKQAGMSDEAAQAIGMAVDAFGKLAEGDLVGAGIDAIQMIISMFPNQAANFADQIERINNALAEEQRLIDVSQRKGGESIARENELTTLKEKLALDQAALQKATDKKDDKVFAFGPVYEAQKKKVIELTNAVIQDKAAIDEAQQALDDFLIGGTTENTIADAIEQGFESGKSSASDFADTFNGFMTTAIVSSLEDMSKPAITEWLKKFNADMVSNGGLDDKESANLKADWNKIVADNKASRDAAFAAAGITPPELSSNSPASKDAMTGVIKGVSEETASVLAGQVNAIRITQADTNSMMRQSIMHLANIDHNTSYLVSIDSKLSGAKGDSLRSQGLV